MYEIVHPQGTQVRETIDMRSTLICELTGGTVVSVLETICVPAVCRLRALIADPAGWISLEAIDNGYRWARPLPQQASQRLLPATTAGAEAAAPPAGTVAAPQPSAQSRPAAAAVEHRMDKADGQAYPLKGFVVAYGGSVTNPPKEWSDAPAVAVNRLDFVQAKRNEQAKLAQQQFQQQEPAVPTRYIGVVKSFDRLKGFGWIVSKQLKKEGKGDIWVHEKDMRSMMHTTVLISTEVTFSLGRTEGRQCATDVMIAGTESSKAPTAAASTAPAKVAMDGGTVGTQLCAPAEPAAKRARPEPARPGGTDPFSAAFATTAAKPADPLPASADNIDFTKVPKVD